MGDAGSLQQQRKLPGHFTPVERRTHLGAEYEIEILPTRARLETIRGLFDSVTFQRLDANGRAQSCAGSNGTLAL